MNSKSKPFPILSTLVLWQFMWVDYQGRLLPMRMPHVIQRLGESTFKRVQNTCMAPTLNATPIGVLINCVRFASHLWISTTLLGVAAFVRTHQSFKPTSLCLLNAHFNAINVVGKLWVIEFITRWNTSLKLKHPCSMRSWTRLSLISMLVTLKRKKEKKLT